MPAKNRIIAAVIAVLALIAAIAVVLIIKNSVNVTDKTGMIYNSNNGKIDIENVLECVGYVGKTTREAGIEGDFKADEYGQITVNFEGLLFVSMANGTLLISDEGVIQRADIYCSRISYAECREKFEGIYTLTDESGDITDNTSYFTSDGAIICLTGQETYVNIVISSVPE